MVSKLQPTTLEKPAGEELEGRKFVDKNTYEIFELENAASS